MQDAQGGAQSPDYENEQLRLRASDHERHQMVELLGEHASVGRLTLGELEDRVGRAYAATTRAELVELTRDLPPRSDAGSLPAAAAGPASGTVSRSRRVVRWFVAVLGGSRRRGRMLLADRVNVIAILGGDDIDLRDAEFAGDEIDINVFCLMGGPSIYVPDTVEVDLSGPAILGGNDERGSARPPRSGAPLIRIRSVAILGGSDVWRLPAESRGLSLKQARRAAKALEHGKG